MSADDGTDSRADPGRQRTVAELLAEHGGGKAGGSRRRRRAPDDDDDQAPAVGQTGGVEVESTGGVGRERSRAGDTRKPATPQQTAPQQTAPQKAQPPRAQPPQVPEQRWAGATGYGQSIDPLTGEPIDTPSGQTFGAPPVNNGQGVTGSRAMPLTRTDPPTEELPQYQERSWASRVKDAGPLTGPITGTAATGTGATGTAATRTGATGTGATRTGATGTAATRTGATGTGATRTGATGAVAGPPTGQVSPADLFDESDADDLDDDEAWGRRASAAPAGLAERGERGEILDEDDEDDDEYDEPDERPEGVTGWLGLIAQWVVGAVAGALLWVGFSYLWMHVPVVALIAAVAATAALVLVVRAIRRSDDLQTTMLAVLVGLVVTISPAVLLLAVR